MLYIPNTFCSLSVRPVHVALTALTFFICLATAQSTQAAVFTIDNTTTREIQLRPMVPNTTITGRVLSPTGRGVPRARVTVTDANGVIIRMAITNPFGFYRFIDVPSGQTYTLDVYSKQFTFLPQTFNTFEEDLVELHFAV